MNMFHSGLGIARSLGERGVPVLGLSAGRRVYGNFTRYARTLRSPDSRNEPESLCDYLLQLGRNIGTRAIIFPTRDDDLVFLDRFREKLDPYFTPVIPSRAALGICLSKWETFRLAKEAAVPTPNCWMINDATELREVADEVPYPCVLKPLESHYWRKSGNWTVVGGRKVIGINSPSELFREYESVAKADPRVILQQMIPGSDACLVVAACYLNRQSEWVAGFNTQKLFQYPEGLGTGCIVQLLDQAELFEPTRALLERIHFSGIAEVEFKWDAAAKDYKLIEINPRPWDQHRLGNAAGTDLIYLAYCDHAGLPAPAARPRVRPVKWIAEDAFVSAVLRRLWNREGKVRSLFRLARGPRIYGIWSAKDPLPFLVYVFVDLIPQLFSGAKRLFRTPFVRGTRRRHGSGSQGYLYESDIEKADRVG